MRRRDFLSNTAALGAVSLLGCGNRPPSASSAPDPPETLYFNLTAEPEHLDPALITGLSDATVAIQIFEGLVTIDPHTLAIRPGVAEKWEVSPDQKRFTFHLRSSKWSDGSPLTSQDFLDSWQRVLTPATGSQYADYLYYIKGAKAFHDGKISDFRAVGVSAPDPATVVVELVVPTPYFLYLAAFHTYMPTKKSATSLGPTWIHPETCIGNGPFNLVEHQPNNRIVLLPNPHYYDANVVKLKKVVIYTTDNLDTCVKMYEAGETQWVRDIPQGHIDRLNKHPDYHATTLWGTMYVEFNVTRKPFNDPKVRAAFSYAIDREKIVKYVTKAGEVSTTALVPPGYPGWSPPLPDPMFDAIQGRKLLAQAGYSGGTGFPVMDILVDQQDVHVRLVEALQAMWKEHLGVSFGIQRREWKVYLSERTAMRYDLSRARWYGDFYDPITFLGIFTSNNGNNHCGYSNHHFDYYIAEADRLAEARSRLGQLMSAEELLVRVDRPIAPLYHLVGRELVSPLIKNMPYNALSLRPLKEVSVALPAP